MCKKLTNFDRPPLCVIGWIRLYDPHVSECTKIPNKISGFRLKNLSLSQGYRICNAQGSYYSLTVITQPKEISLWSKGGSQEWACEAYCSLDSCSDFRERGNPLKRLCVFVRACGSARGLAKSARGLWRSACLAEPCLWGSKNNRSVLSGTLLEPSWGMT